MDELWTFIGKKQQARWLWIAWKRSTRRVLAWVALDRSQQTAFDLWDSLLLIPEQRLKGTFCTDLWAAYDAPLVGVHRVPRKGQTTRVERLNCTLRQRLGRLGVHLYERTTGQVTFGLQCSGRRTRQVSDT